jgi:hypothetical protein
VRHTATERNQLLEQILAIELEMFLTVNGDELASCQLDSENFLGHRRAQFSAWSLPTLNSYLADLQEAEADGFNLMTVKYARMEGLLPPLNTNPALDEIMRISTAWQAEMFARYPAFMSRARPLSESGSREGTTAFDTYARSEYETYSDRTIEVLLADMQAGSDLGENWSEVVYDHLVRERGYASLAEAERSLKGQALS